MLGKLCVKKLGNMKFRELIWKQCEKKEIFFHQALDNHFYKWYNTNNNQMRWRREVAQKFVPRECGHGESRISESVWITLPSSKPKGCRIKWQVPKRAVWLKGAACVLVTLRVNGSEIKRYSSRGDVFRTLQRLKSDRFCDNSGGTTGIMLPSCIGRGLFVYMLTRPE